MIAAVRVRADLFAKEGLPDSGSSQDDVEEHARFVLGQFDVSTPSHGDVCLVAMLCAFAEHRLGKLRRARSFSLCALDKLKQLCPSAPGPLQDGVSALRLIMLAHALEIAALTDDIFEDCLEDGRPRGDNLFQVTHAYLTDGRLPKGILDRLRALMEIPNSGLTLEARLAHLTPIPSMGDAVTVEPRIHSVAIVIRHAHYRIWRGHFERAELLLNAATQTLNETSTLPERLAESFRAEVGLFRGRISMRRGDLDDAANKFRAALEEFVRLGNEFACIKARRYQAELAYRRRDVKLAFALALDVERDAGCRRYYHDEAMARLLLGKLMSALGHCVPAVRMIEQSLRHFRSYQGFKTILDAIFWKAVSLARCYGPHQIVPQRVSLGYAAVRARSAVLEGAEKIRGLSLIRGVSLSDTPGDPRAIIMQEIRECQAGPKTSTISESLYLICVNAELSVPLIDGLILEAQLAAARDLKGGVCPAIVARSLRYQRGANATKNLTAEHWREVENIDQAFVGRAREFFRLGSADAVVKHAILDAMACAERIAEIIPSLYAALDKAGYKGGLIPHFAELSLYFGIREVFLTRIMSIGERCEAMWASGSKDAWISRLCGDLSRYLVVERNAHVSVPCFSIVPGSTTGESVQAKRAYDAFLDGDGASDVSHDRRFGLGWVEEVQADQSIVRVFWMENNRCDVRLDSELQFTPYVIASTRLVRGGALQAGCPLSVVVRRRAGVGEPVFHRIPGLSDQQLFEGVDALVPSLQAWNQLAEAFTRGRVGTRISGGDVSGWRALYEVEADKLFGGRLPPDVFSAIFELPGTIKPDDKDWDDTQVERLSQHVHDLEEMFVG